MPDQRDPERHQINVWFPVDLYDAIDRISKTTGDPRSHVVIRLVDERLHGRRMAAERREWYKTKKQGG